MLRHIMVPLDGSAFAERALPLAMKIARHTGARLDLVLVRALLPRESAEVAWDYMDRLGNRLRADLPGRVTEHVLTDEVGPLEYPISLSTVAEVLSRHAVEYNADLIVMATHGRGGMRRAWLGSAGDSLMRIAPRPVLLFNPDFDGPGIAMDERRGIHHIIIPLDGSELSEQVIPYAAALGEAFDSRYTLVRVIAPPSVRLGIEWNPADLSMPIPPPDRDMIVRYLNNVAADMRARGLRVSTHIIEAPAPASAIIEYARQEHADMIAISTAGAGGVRRILIGSVADRVARRAGMPVLVCNVRNFGGLLEPMVGRDIEQVGVEQEV